ncbi:beta-galactosidase [Reticulomyxa filosa]|uniref:Beta-galactosidase n=1 Tax=Reticulomyxa filosa TaxID=46433 RepID=X6N3E8_RETFI|nr:beta-galactosidase [Reticulomyxa filosa]|eukprot:ETO20383.1 beta-galactosidase [Reticulomyxa filosa]
MFFFLSFFHRKIQFFIYTINIIINSTFAPKLFNHNSVGIFLNLKDEAVKPKKTICIISCDCTLHLDSIMLLSLLGLVAIFLCVSKASKPKDTVPSGPFLYYNSLKGQPYNVTYDERSFIINGQRTLLLGGSVHYPRLSVLQWDDILTKARDDGLNHVEVYVFWNLHEPTYDFSGNHVYIWTDRANLPLFLQKCKENDLFVNLRIGPYVCAFSTYSKQNPEISNFFFPFKKKKKKKKTFN